MARALAKRKLNFQKNPPVSPNVSNLRFCVLKAGTQAVKLLFNNQFEFLDSGFRRNDEHFLP